MIDLTAVLPDWTLIYIMDLVLRQHDIAGFRATRMRQCKTQSAGNGKPFSRTATPHWRIWVAAFGIIMFAKH